MYFVNVNVEYLETNNIYLQWKNINSIFKGVASLPNGKNIIMKTETYCFKPLKIFDNMILAIRLLINWFILKKFISNSDYRDPELSRIQNMVTYIIKLNNYYKQCGFTKRL